MAVQEAQTLETELDATKAVLDTERQERMRIVASLKGTIERVRLAGQEEQRLRDELHAQTELAERLQEQLAARERAALVAADELNRTHTALEEAVAKIGDLTSRLFQVERDAGRKDRMVRTARAQRGRGTRTARMHGA